MSRKIAFCGIFSALSVVLLYFAFILPSGKFSFYALSSLPVAIAVLEFGAGAGASVFVVTSLLTFLLTGLLASIPYISFFGLYSLLKYYIEKSRNVFIEVSLKLASFNIFLLIYYFISIKLFSNPTQALGNNITILIIIAQIVFFLYDYVFSRLLYYYEDKIRDRVMKGTMK